MKGVEQIRRGHTTENQGKLKDANIRLIKLEIRFIRPDIAIVHQLHEMSGKRNSDGTPMAPHQQISTRVLVKEQGQWITTAVQNSNVNSRPSG
jgi:uncharacterized protein (TIGR02246 family)